MSQLQLKDYDENKWHSLAAKAAQGIETRLFINGDYVDSVEGGRFETVNPATGETLAGNPLDVDTLSRVAASPCQSGSGVEEHGKRQKQEKSSHGVRPIGSFEHSLDAHRRVRPGDTCNPRATFALNLRPRGEINRHRMTRERNP